MASITFDTLKFANRLKAAGVSAQHAEAEAEALSEVFETNLGDLATKKDVHDEVALVRKDLQILETRMDAKFADMRGEMLLLKWMLGVIVAGTIALVLKAFF